MINEWTLLILLLMPLAAFMTGGLLINLWAHTRKLLNTVTMPMPLKTSHRRHIYLHSASRRY